MTTNIKRVTRTREYVAGVVESCKPGTRLFTHELATALCIQLHHGESAHDIGMAMRERDDVRSEGKGVWVKI